MSSNSNAAVTHLGAGPVTQAIHLPSLARLGNILEVRHIMDVDAVVAESVAARVGGRHSTKAAPAALQSPNISTPALCPQFWLALHS